MISEINRYKGTDAAISYLIKIEKKKKSRDIIIAIALAAIITTLFILI